MLVKRFKGRCVKRMRRVPGGILLTFLAIKPRVRGEKLIVSQAEWEQHGTESYIDQLSLAQLRRQEEFNSSCHLQVALRQEFLDHEQEEH